MLYLSRKLNEVIMIGKDIKVVVREIKGKTVSLGFEAPKQVSIHRGEEFRRLTKKKQSNDCFYALKTL